MSALESFCNQHKIILYHIIPKSRMEAQQGLDKITHIFSGEANHRLSKSVLSQYSNLFQWRLTVERIRYRRENLT
jgi:maltooligosyltrehalose synthase